VTLLPHDSERRGGPQVTFDAKNTGVFEMADAGNHSRPHRIIPRRNAPRQSVRAGGRLASMAPF